MGTKISQMLSALVSAIALLNISACAPRITNITPAEGQPGTVVNLSMQYLVGWPRVEIAEKTLDWPHLKLMATAPDRRNISGEELIWIEDKILQFRIPDLPPADYKVIVHDDKGPPGDRIYSALETTAYVIFPPVWPFVFRSNQTEFMLRVLPER